MEIIAGSLGYLEKRGEQMHYAHYQAAGYPIGSGIVESAPQTQVHAARKGVSQPSPHTTYGADAFGG